MTTEAEDGSKKKAKNRAAALMIEKILKELPISSLTKDEGMAELVSKIAKVDLCDTPKIVCRDRARCSQLFAHDHHRFQSLIGPKVFELHNVS